MRSRRYPQSPPPRRHPRAYDGTSSGSLCPRSNGAGAFVKPLGRRSRCNQAPAGLLRRLSETFACCRSASLRWWRAYSGGCERCPDGSVRFRKADSERVRRDGQSAAKCAIPIVRDRSVRTRANRQLPAAAPHRSALSQWRWPNWQARKSELQPSSSRRFGSSTLATRRVSPRLS